MKTHKFKQTEIGKIPKDWEIVKLSDVAVVNNLTLDNSFSYREIEYIDIATVNQGFISEIKTIPLKEAPSRARRIVRNNDIVLSTVRPNLKHFAFMKNVKPNTVASTGFAVITSKNIHPQFLYYYISTDRYTYYLSAIADMHTSTYPACNPDVIENSLIPYPPLPDQRTIAKILSDLDEKIELNRQMNKTLESIAQAIFKHWFIDFEFPNKEGKPYKSSGGKMVESELGEMPIVWDVGTFQEMCDITMGQSPPGRTYNETGKGIAFYQGNRDFGFRFPMTRVFCTSPTRFAKKGDVLISVRAPVGALNIANESCAVGRGLAAIRMKNHSNSFVYYFLKSNTETWNVYDNEGTVFGSINKSTLHKMKLVMPYDIVLTKFDKKICAVDTQIFNNEMQNFALAQIRDSLLPKLMSGEINTINN